MKNQKNNPKINLNTVDDDLQSQKALNDYRKKYPKPYQPKKVTKLQWLLGK